MSKCYWKMVPIDLLNTECRKLSSCKDTIPVRCKTNKKNEMSVMGIVKGWAFQVDGTISSRVSWREKDLGGCGPSVRSGCLEPVSKNGVGGETAFSPIFLVALFPWTLFLGFQRPCHWASPVTEEPPPKVGDVRDAGSIPAW